MKKIDETRAEYHVYLVTNRHVLESIEKIEKAQVEEFSGKAKTDGGALAYLRFNPRGTGKASEDFAAPLRKRDGTFEWFHHKDVDLTVLPIDTDVLNKAGMQYNFFYSDAHVADRAKASELGLTEGDGAYALGFPMGLVGGERNFVIARQGSIARIRDFLGGSSREFLVDMLIFPGNSGGPVVTRTELNAIQGTKRQDRSYLIGVVRGYLPYRDVAVSKQTGLERVTFEENSGLAAVIPMDFVMEVIEEHRKTLPK